MLHTHQVISSIALLSFSVLSLTFNLWNCYKLNFRTLTREHNQSHMIRYTHVYFTRISMPIYIEFINNCQYYNYAAVFLSVYVTS